MEDFERYGDYNEIDEPPGRSYVGLILKIVSAVLILAVVGIVAARIIIFNYYPEEMRSIHFTDRLLEHYNEKGGKIDAITQKLRAPYDDPTDGNFFCDHLIIVPEIDQLQICLRYNTSIKRNLAYKYGVADFDPDNTEQFSFRLWRNGYDGSEEGAQIGRLVVEEWDSYSMYRYCKLVFMDVDLTPDEENGISWIRLEIFIDGVDREEPFMVAIYENHEEYSKFKEYKISKKELP